MREFFAPARYDNHQRRITMSQILIALSYWLHSLATVIFIGHYLLLAIIYLPAIKNGSLDVTGPILSQISKQSRR